LEVELHLKLSSSTGGGELSFSDKLLLELEESGFDCISLFFHFVSTATGFDASLLVELLASPETIALKYIIRVSKAMEALGSFQLNNRFVAFCAKNKIIFEKPEKCDVQNESALTILWVEEKISYNVDSVRVKNSNKAKCTVSHEEWKRKKQPQLKEKRSKYDLVDFNLFLSDFFNLLQSSYKNSLLPFNPLVICNRLKKLIGSETV
jgi:hypothetical protein